MLLNTKPNSNFDPLLKHVTHTFNQVICSGAAVFVIQNDSVVLEEYIGEQSNKPDARDMQPDTQFHVASVRKSYIGFAVAYAVHIGCINSIDDLAISYLPELNENVWKDTTIKHLLTHTHGLSEKEGAVYREYEAGEKWTYRQVGVSALTQIVKRTTGQTISKIVHGQVFTPLGFSESDWYAEKNEKLVDVILRSEHDSSWRTSKSTEGDKMNMYVSARELALWEYLHLKEGRVNGEQIIPKEVIQLATSLQSPAALDLDSPQNGFLWFVKDLPAKETEIGERVPRGSYQILGYTGVTLLVIPEENIVAVRMFNSFGSPEGYDYLQDIRSFGDTVMRCLGKVRN
ncbi:serine hydrolase domain-containing protein [Metabacillus sp. cB07]|uniref:serine hydrolase domain-containing protein n=1 Tax=Metabacillus sp. cB07 TaxID=2806989 RepID=UPI0019399A32|nr:serine hydrolase domain-containing protein [Metabacillus sp. cB07]